MNPLFAAMGTSIFERMSLAAARHGAVNLGQGFPDFGWNPAILDAAKRALDESNQYPPSRGLPVLRQAVADHYRRHSGQDLAAEQICVTSGATEAIAATLMAILSPGDEVVVMAPAYDAYAPLVRRAGGIVRELALAPPDWRISAQALDAAITPRCRMILFNNPHNPTGRLFDREELDAVASVARDRDLLVLSDEVWEHVLLGDTPFVPIATLPGMAQRTVKIGSAGKIFSLTGWKVGWAVAPDAIAAQIARAHQFLTFATAPNLQSAVAFGLDRGDGWFAPVRARFAEAKRRLETGLVKAGYVGLDTQATYFQCIDLARSGIGLDDKAFAAMAVERAGVAVIPVSAFYEGAGPRNLVRLCFAKNDDTLDAGIAALTRARAIAGQG